MKLFLYSACIAFLLSVSQVYAHEMTPTYPKWEHSYLDSVLKTTMQIFNKRADVEYYEVGVFDKDFNAIPFVTSYKIIKISYLGHVTFDVYIRKDDKDRAVYLCSISMLKKDNTIRTAITSRICSKFKNE